MTIFELESALPSVGDHQQHDNNSYRVVCWAAEKSYLQDVIPQFFARDDSDPAFAKCSRGVGRLDFLHAPLFATHGLAVQAYLKTASPTRRLVVLSYVGVWTKVWLPPQELE